MFRQQPSKPQNRIDSLIVSARRSKAMSISPEAFASTAKSSET